MVRKIGREGPRPSDLLTLGQIRHYLPTRPSYDTLYRWCTVGLKGITLDHESHGAWYYTSLANYERFNQRLQEKRR